MMAVSLKHFRFCRFSLAFFLSLSFCLYSKPAAKPADLSGSPFIYVDNQLPADCTGSYSIENRDCSGSDGFAYKNIAGAANAATQGTVVLIRGGSYPEPLSPANSGTEGNEIIFKNYLDELVEITGETLNPAIWIDRKAYITIEGLEIRSVRRWLNALGSHHLIIRNNVFEKALDAYGSSKTGVFLQSCSHVKILNNKLHDTTQDNLGMVDCDFNLIEGNTITRAFHTLWALKCSNYNIIRNNYFHNELQKIGEIYDCDNAGYGEGEFPKLTSFDDTKYNIVERNVFAFTASSGNASPYAGIQYAGQHGIIRNNIYYECTGPPLDLTLYGDEATYNYSNRIYNNTFYDNNFGGISISGNTNYTFSDQKFKNNLLYKNKFIQNDMRWSWYAELDEKPVQILTGTTDEVLFEGNNIFHSEADELYAIAYGSRTSSSNPAPQPLSWWETNHANMFQNNLQKDPQLEDPFVYDFHLAFGSPMIDAGHFLTTTTNTAENSTVMQVDDAGWFSDGFGLVSGDTIQLEDEEDHALIISIDYPARLLTLDRSLSWHSGQGVTIKYNGKGPDIGAFEYVGIINALPAADTKQEIFPASLNLVCTPNPFNPRTMIKYELSGASHVEMVVFDSSGRKVVQLVNGYRGAGSHTVSWNAVDDQGRQIASGVYLLRLRAGIKVKQVKLVYLR
jgi:hypothetical protein